MKKYNVELTSKELQMLEIALITKICSIENFLKIKGLNEDIYSKETKDLIEYENLKEKLNKIS